MRLLASAGPNTVAMTTSGISFDSTQFQLLGFAVITYVDGNGHPIRVKRLRSNPVCVGHGDRCSYSLTVDINSAAKRDDDHFNNDNLDDQWKRVQLMINFGQSDPASSTSTNAGLYQPVQVYWPHPLAVPPIPIPLPGTPDDHSMRGRMYCH